MNEPEKKSARMRGIWLGIFLYIVWCILVFSLESLVSPTGSMNLAHPVIAWLYYGSIPVCIAIGMCFMLRKFPPDPEILREYSALNVVAISFIAWTFVVMICKEILGNSDAFTLTILGYLLMIILIVVFQCKNPALPPA